MATERELFEALKETLESNGQLSKMKAEMRAEILKALDYSQIEKRPVVPRLAYIVNELIREYLEWSGYHYTSTVLVTESGLPSERLERSVLMQDIGVTDNANTSKLPLLYSLISTFRNQMSN